MTIADDIRDHYERIAEQTRKAACYLAVSRAVLRVPNFARRWTDSDCSEALHYTRDGTHMAFAVTLAALYDTTRDTITIPKLLTRLGDRGVQYAVARERQVALDVIRAGAHIAVRRLARIQSLPIYGSLRELRHNVIAHHNADTTSHGATQGRLNRLMVRTVVLVDQLAEVIKGERVGIAGLAREVLSQSAAVWSHGMDADPYGSLEQRDTDDPSRR
jgi:hypothetical protein